MLAQGMSGAMFMIGKDGEPPQSSANYKADYICGMQFLAAVTMALMARMRFGVGQRVHVSLLGAEVHNQIQQAEAYLNAGVMLRGPDRHRAFKTSDGWIANSLVFEEICETVDRGDLCRDPRFDSVEKQWANLDEWRAILEPYFLRKTTAEWEEVMAEKDIMGGPVLSYKESFNHPQVAQQEVVAEVEHPHGGTFKTLGLPLDLSETPMEMSRRPPALGEHTAEILGEIGYSPPEIEALIEKGVVQQYPAGN